MSIQQAENAQRAWDRIAPAYDDVVTAQNMALAEEALRRVALRPGMRLLDVAAGTGALSIPAARLGARVTATDLSPVMVERLQKRAHDEGLSELEVRVMDGHALELEDATFDVAASQFGVMLFPDLPRGLRELARVTRPGGRVVMVTFGGPPARLEFLAFFLGAVRAVVPGFAGLPLDPPPLPLQVTDAEVLRERMADAGLHDIGVHSANHRMKFRSGAHMWDAVTNSNPIGAALVADLTEAQSEEVRQVLDGMLAERSGGGPAVLDNPVNIAIGTR